MLAYYPTLLMLMGKRQVDLSFVLAARAIDGFKINMQKRKIQNKQEMVGDAFTLPGKRRERTFPEKEVNICSKEAGLSLVQDGWCRALSVMRRQASLLW